MSNLNSRSPLAEAVARFAESESRENRQAVIQALGSAVAFVCVPSRPEIARTGYEPRFQILEILGRRLVLSDVPEAGLQLFLFSNRESADSFCTKVSGFVAEPIACAVAAEVAMRANAMLAIDPVGAMILLSHAEIEWGPSRPPARQSFPDALEAWMQERTPERLAAAKSAFRDTVFYLLVPQTERPNAAASLASTQRFSLPVIGERTLLLELLDGVWFLCANTDRATSEGWSEGTEVRALAVDGPALAEAAMQANADLGIAVCGVNKLAIDPVELRDLWPRRSLTPDDF